MNPIIFQWIIYIISQLITDEIVKQIADGLVKFIENLDINPILKKIILNFIDEETIVKLKEWLIDYLEDLAGKPDNPITVEHVAEVRAKLKLPEKVA
jgi:hypothetical protein